MNNSKRGFYRILSFVLAIVLVLGSLFVASAEELKASNVSAKENISYENYQIEDLPEIIANSILTTDTTPIGIINQDSETIYFAVTR